MGRGTLGRLGADVFVDNDGITDLEVVYYVSRPRVLRLVIIMEMVIDNLRLRRPYDDSQFFQVCLPDAFDRFKHI